MFKKIAIVESEYHETADRCSSINVLKQDYCGLDECERRKLWQQTIILKSLVGEGTFRCVWLISLIGDVIILLQ